VNAPKRLEEMPIVAACALLIRDDDKVLVIHDFRRGTGLPAGSIDTGESPLACALRELEEETGIKPVSYLLEPIYDGITDTGKRAQTFLVQGWHGEARSSIEGDVEWKDRNVLISAKAAYPIYNGEVLKKYDTQYGVVD
jgi:8-oxo-dGTP pyrophosphatase MutT (NUDIX family)